MNGSRPVIHVAPADTGKDGRFIASFNAEVLGSTYAVVFPETVTGAIAFHRFVQMIEHQYGKQVEIRLSDELLPFHENAVTDLLRSLSNSESQKLHAVG